MNTGHSNGLCVAHGAHMAVALVSNRERGLYKLTVSYLSQSQQSFRPTLGYLRNDLGEVPHVGTYSLPFTAA